MERINVLIVEDNLIIAQDLAGKLNKNGFTVVGTLESGEEAIKELANKNIDIILMDIQLAGKMTGIETARKIKDNYNIPIVYLSDYTDKDTVKEALGTFPSQYLSKPYNITEIIRTLEIAFNNSFSQPHLKKFSDRVFVKTKNNELVIINYNDIIYLEADGSYCNIITANDKYIYSQNMKTIFSQFSSSTFLKVHRGHIININHIVALGGNVLRMSNGDKIQISQKHRPQLEHLITQIK